ncbi:hypothetical protein ANME2D_02121 [Candidatus Methanoperedens nitroreducens]|uniref:Uncharacterized protein n=1 Tax=Candidatus Methanoperedens nitratireducens TaxID=1392998 RepID=A0A062V473_9EURY|nr:hypothetical protein [Candidatus Methanoperedens nitroreducens]KCZ71393.1 hypothetical protein ANME2D_02121 [Candidatus Methanoperedens nitroreducens]MDJ1421020.1 hypothetical protein [Candidatus Methanoperedens sp.]
MRIVDFIDSLESAASKYSLKPRVLIKTENAVKARIEISDSIYIQFYHHQLSGTSNYVLVGWNNRLYGRDCIGGNWHRHPFENPQAHDRTGDGAEDITLDEFLDEVFEILLREKLI